MSRVTEAAKIIQENARLFVAGDATVEDFWRVFHSSLDALCDEGPLEGDYLSLFESLEKWEVSLPSDRNSAEDDIRTKAKTLPPL